jgi:hypothetical protein
MGRPAPRTPAHRPHKLHVGKVKRCEPGAGQRHAQQCAALRARMFAGRTDAGGGCLVVLHTAVLRARAAHRGVSTKGTATTYHRCHREIYLQKHITGQAGLVEKSPKSGAPAGPSCAHTRRSHHAAACSGCMPGGAAAPGPAATRSRRRRRRRPRAAPPRCAAKTRRRPAPWRPCAGSLGCWRPPGRSAAGHCAPDPNVIVIGVSASTTTLRTAPAGVRAWRPRGALARSRSEEAQMWHADRPTWNTFSKASRHMPATWLQDI